MNKQAMTFIPVNDVPDFSEQSICNAKGEFVRVSEMVTVTTDGTGAKIEQPISTPIAPPEFMWGFLFDMAPSIYSDGNRIYFHSEIHRDSVEQAKQKIIEVGKEMVPKYIELGITDPKEMKIILYIDSMGGAISSGFNLIDFMRNYHIPIYTIGSGTVASMAVLLLLSGKKRYLTENSNLLAHQFRAGFSGKRDELLDYFKHLEDVQEQLISYMSDNTKLTKNEVERLLKNESWLTPKESLDMGFIDEII